jgi:HlyD family secretion protein
MRKLIAPDDILQEIKSIEEGNKLKEFLKNKKMIVLIAVVFFLLVSISLYSYRYYLKSIPEVKTIPVVRSALINSVSCNGVVIAKEQITVSSKVAGVIKDIFVQDGDFVEKDKLLIEIDDTQINNQILNQDITLSSAKANLQQAKILLDDAERNLNLTEELFNAGAVSKENLEMVKNQYKKAKIGYDTADNTGRIKSKYCEGTVK